MLVAFELLYCSVFVGVVVLCLTPCVDVAVWRVASCGEAWNGSE